MVQMSWPGGIADPSGPGRRESLRMTGQPTQDPRVAEEAHPGAVLAPAVGVPGHLDRAEDALGVGHDDREAAVGGRDARDARAASRWGCTG